MNNHITAACLAAAALFGAGPATAATLGLTTEAPSLSASGAVIDFFDFGTDGELLTNIPEVDGVDGVSPIGFTTIDFVVGFSTADPSDTSDFAFGGFIDISDEDGQFLVGDLAAIGFVEDVIELWFNNLSGSGAGSFGSSVLALVAFDDPLGADPFASLVDGDSLEASITVSNVADVAPIPLPASMLFLLGGLLSLAAQGARKPSDSISCSDGESRQCQRWW